VEDDAVVLKQLLLEVERQNRPASVTHMISEVLRDIGILVLTFIPLDTVFQKQPVPTYIFWGGILWGLVFITLGMWLEKHR
jgi:hypothetical protein